MADTYVQLPDGTYVQVPPDASPTQLQQFKIKLAGMQQSPEQQAPNAAMQAKQQLMGNIKSLIPGTATPDPTNGAMAQAQSGQNPQYNDYMKQSGGIASTMAGGMGGGAIASNLATQGLPKALGILGKASAVGAGVGAGQLANEPNKPVEALSTAAGTTAGGVALSPVFKFFDALAGKAKAGQAFQEVMSKTKDVPIDVGPVQDAAFRAEQMSRAGGQLPKVIRDFIKETTDASKPAMDYERARDFYTNATGKMAPDEAQKMTPTMFRQLGEFTSALRKSITDATASAGQARTFGQAMQQYHDASKAQDLLEWTKEAMLNKIKQAGTGGAAAAGGYGVYKALSSGKK